MDDLSELFIPIKDQNVETYSIKDPGITYWQDAWERLRQNKLALFGLFFLTFLVIMSIIGPMLRSYTYYETHLQVKNLKPCALFWF